MNLFSVLSFERQRMEMRGIFGARRQSLNANVQVAKRNVQNKNFVRFNGFFCVSRNLSTGSLNNLNRLDEKTSQIDIHFSNADIIKCRQIGWIAIERWTKRALTFDKILMGFHYQ